MKCLSASLGTASALVGFGFLFSSVAFAQSSVSLNGRVLDATGQPISHPVVRLVTDTTSQPSAHPWRYTLIGDSLGKFSQEGIAPGAYLVMLFTDGKAVNVLRTVSLKAGEATELDFNLGSQQPVRVVTSGTTYSMVAKGNISERMR